MVGVWQEPADTSQGEAQDDFHRLCVDDLRVSGHPVAASAYRQHHHLGAGGLLGGPGLRLLSSRRLCQQHLCRAAHLYLHDGRRCLQQMWSRAAADGRRLRGCG
ncbi:uncharacterized protein LOC135115203 isoform X2 [Scylla paramamosain]|uniref:uncharacterized protein LOC135115203 isoform X2 n=1 Tax=Scylla paramamosain TaxID=85552 RepID=UPI00308294E3